ncbi:DoxX family protein [Humisphaera borealis]|uniref:DoxX family protein n=1 Tax=Humisphaera borealis TaxID=2807512 RepID=A0A7M2WTH2_9BACT|nr:DoxX family protein [Humisphaera borealis]
MSASFLGFGCGYLLVPRMQAEFVRYQLAHLLPAAAWLQIAGALGLLLGLRYPLPGIIAAGGLALMMAVAVATRLRIGDPLLQCVPAVLYLLLNVYLCATFIGQRSTS